MKKLWLLGLLFATSVAAQTPSPTQIGTLKTTNPYPVSILFNNTWYAMGSVNTSLGIFTLPVGEVVNGTTPILTSANTWGGLQTLSAGAKIGGSTGLISILNPSAASDYNFNLPATAGAANSPLISGGGGATAMGWGARSGTTTTFATTTGSLTSGNCVNIDANGNLKDAGGPCTTGGGGGTVTSGTAGQMAYYGSTGTTVTGNPNATISSGALTLGVAASVQGSLVLGHSSSGATTIAAPTSGTGTLTLPSGTDTLVGRATTDTLTNKTIDTAGPNTLKIAGTSLTATTGTGSVVLASSPTLTTPTLGTPASVTLTNGTGLPLSTGVTGTLPVANGGTGATTATGATTNLLPSQTGNANKILTTDGSGNLSWTTPGTVSNVGLSLPSIFTVTNSPVTTTGTLTGTLNSQTANTFFAAPNGLSGTPTFRAIVGADIPTLNQNTTGTAANVTGTVAISNGGTGATSQQGALNAIAGATTSGQYLRGNGTNVVLGAIQAGDVPTLNQNTTGTAAGLSGSQTANYVYAAPNGAPGTAAFRALVAADVPTLNQNTTGTAANVTGVVATPNGGTGLSTGTSGGIPYFNSATTMASSGLLTQYGIVYGGGAGAAPVATAAGAANSVLIGNGASAPSFSSVSNLLDGAISSTQGVLLYRSGTGWSALATGTAGQILQSGGAAANPTWTSSLTSAAPQLTLGANSGTLGTLKLNGSTSGAVTLQVPAAAGTTTFTLPSSNGTSGQYLKTDGAGNTSWVSSSSITPGEAFRAVLSADQTGITLNAPFKVTINGVTSQSGTAFNTTTNRFTPTVAGYYQVNAQLFFSKTSGTITTLYSTSSYIYKNGSSYAVGQTVYNYALDVGNASVSDIVYMNGSTDYIELYGEFVEAGTSVAAKVGAASFFSASYLRGP